MGSVEQDRTTRRELLAGALGGMAALAAGGAARGAPVRMADKRYGPFRVGLQSYSLRGYRLAAAMDKTEKLGVHYWEAISDHVALLDTPDARKDMLARFAADRITLLAWGVQSFGPDEAYARRVLGFAKAMGLRVVSADPSPDALPMLDRLAPHYGVGIAIHNHGPGSRYAKVADVQAAVKGRHPLIGACVDTGHCLRSGEDPVAVVRALGKRVLDVHLKDVKGGTQFTVLGQGDLRTVALFRALHDLRYGGPVMLEYEEHPEDPIADIDVSLAAARSSIQKALAGVDV